MLLFIIPLIAAATSYSEINPNHSVDINILDGANLRSLQRCHIHLVFLHIYSFKMKTFEPIREVLCNFLWNMEKFKWKSDEATSFFKIATDILKYHKIECQELAYCIDSKEEDKGPYTLNILMKVLRGHARSMIELNKKTIIEKLEKDETMREGIKDCFKLSALYADITGIKVDIKLKENKEKNKDIDEHVEVQSTILKTKAALIKRCEDLAQLGNRYLKDLELLYQLENLYFD